MVTVSIQLSGEDELLRKDGKFAKGNRGQVRFGERGSEVIAGKQVSENRHQGY